MQPFYCGACFKWKSSGLENRAYAALCTVFDKKVFMFEQKSRKKHVFYDGHSNKILIRNIHALHFVISCYAPFWSQLIPSNEKKNKEKTGGENTKQTTFHIMTFVSYLLQISLK